MVNELFTGTQVVTCSGGIGQIRGILTGDAAQGETIKRHYIHGVGSGKSPCAPEMLCAVGIAASEQLIWAFVEEQIGKLLLPGVANANKITVSTLRLVEFDVDFF